MRVRVIGDSCRVYVQIKINTLTVRVVFAGSTMGHVESTEGRAARKLRANARTALKRAKMWSRSLKRPAKRPRAGVVVVQLLLLVVVLVGRVGTPSAMIGAATSVVGGAITPSFVKKQAKRPRAGVGATTGTANGVDGIWGGWMGGCEEIYVPAWTSAF